MDTISRENNSYLPVAGLIAGVVAALLAVVALVKVSNANKTLADHQAKVEKIDSIEAQVGSANQVAANAAANVKSLTESTQQAFNSVGAELGNLRTSVTAIEEKFKKAPAPGKDGKPGAKEAPVAGPGEYVIKAGDTGMKVAKAHGCSVEDLKTVNPGVDWTKMKVGQKIKLPAK